MYVHSSSRHRMAARGWSKVTLWSCFALATALCLQVVAGKNHIALHKHALVKEVQEGETVTLPCPSNDEEHRFLFWQLIDDTVIGPANHHSHANKFDYEHTSTADSGYYKCVSKGIKEPNFFILPVELVVKKDWEILWESDTTLNVLRVFLALIVMAVLAGIVFVVFKMRRNGYVKGDED
ncbi:hypothetical protein B566_EDAN003095 [Ephemera danica]|nr:hypothetical protein B566_EDAN003095 [Ephemera danica]